MFTHSKEELNNLEQRFDEIKSDLQNEKAQHVKKSKEVSGMEAILASFADKSLE